MTGYVIVAITWFALGLYAHTKGADEWSIAYMIIGNVWAVGGTIAYILRLIHG